jgi:homospermidine synthase
VLGCGSVAQCTIPLLIDDLGISPSSIQVVDFVDNRHRIAGPLSQGVTYETGRLTRENLDEFLSARCSDGDILLDLAWNIDCPTILQWCFDHNVRYLNTSVEVWDPYEDLASTHPLERTLYVRHQELRRLKQRWGRPGATAVLEHGANPGLVSHFVKRALAEMSGRMLSDGTATGSRAAAMESALASEEFNQLAMLTGTKVVHISERDTQLAAEPKRVNEFVNTWSVDGLYEEGIAPAELGWGTHERTLPRNAWVHEDDGPRNQICIARPGMETWVRSWVPAGEIRGMVVRHGEAYTMSDHLTVWDHGTAVYRPTVHYAYCPSDAAIMSVHELLMRNYEMQPEQRILNDEIIQGEDQLGVLLMGHDYRAWWTGSILGIHEARGKVPHQSATTLQVAASVMAAVKWMIAEPQQGIKVPDELPHEFVLEAATPYLGTIWSDAVDWDPLRTRRDVFDQWSDSAAGLDRDDPWQFGNFLCP